MAVCIWKSRSHEAWQQGCAAIQPKVSAYDDPRTCSLLCKTRGSRGGSNISQQDDLEDHGRYQDPSLICDIVMKGGITSGITYPGAVCEIAETYRLRNIGGTSAGAIAAAGAAASEAGRTVPGAGFARLARLPGRLSADTPAPGWRGSVMFNVFQPSEETEPLFRVLVAVLNSKEGSHEPGDAANGSFRTFLTHVRRMFHTVRAVLPSAVAATPLGSLIGAAFGIVVLALLIATGINGDASRSGALGKLALVVVILAALALAVGGMVVGCLVSLLCRGLGAVPRNNFGLCSGFVAGEVCPEGTSGEDDLQLIGRALAPKPLTTWLADELDALAGKTNPDEPLTLGDLARHGVTLKMFTTNLSEGTPYTLPFRDRAFFFSPDEFRDLFPPRIVDWMTSERVRPEPPLDRDARERFETMTREGLVPFPDPENLPVVVMTRLSLSFPLLMSAVPLWALRWSYEDEELRATRCFFSDGGITSNFPIHFFDSPLPRWPTFGVNLGQDEKLDPEDQRKNIYAPRTNSGGIGTRWGKIETVPEFVHAIADTMQNWMDSAQTRVPGYRDRIVVIKHTKSEGGMNLTMDHDAIEKFSARGAAAGEYLVNRFSGAASTNPKDDLSWENHRWVRYRSLMPLLEDLLIDLTVGYDWSPDPTLTKTFAELIGEPPDDAPSYHWDTQAQQRRAIFLTDQLLELARSWGNLPNPVPSSLPEVDLSIRIEGSWDHDRPFAAGAPRPRPTVRIVKDF
jgi:predicted acylesterase/phospholipase RssA